MQIITDATGVGIIIFGSPGTTVSQNQVLARHRSSIGGIFLVSTKPFDGNYTGTIISDNVVDASGPQAYFRVGIGSGAAIWTDDQESVLYNASIIGNTVQGESYGYGIAVTGVEGWTVQENTVTVGEDGFWGVSNVGKCPDDPPNHPPTSFLYNPDTSHGSFQTDFVAGSVSFCERMSPPGLTGCAIRMITFVEIVACIDDHERALRETVQEATTVEDTTRVRVALHRSHKSKTSDQETRILGPTRQGTSHLGDHARTLRISDDASHFGHLPEVHR